MVSSSDLGKKVIEIKLTVNNQGSNDALRAIGELFKINAVIV
jgi:hypothetical protein